MLDLRVRSVTWEAQDTLSYELVHPQGGPLPVFEAGAHLEVDVPGGLRRRYSLHGAPSDRLRYRSAVLDVAGGRGGSRAMHQQVRPGQLLRVDGPFNHFPLAAQARRSILLAGGIGITPLMSMAEHLQAAGAQWELHYCTRSPERTAFIDALAHGAWARRVHIHHDGGDPARSLDLAALLRQPDEGTHVYYCGPAGFMAAARAACAHWPAEQLHFEFFGADPAALPAAPEAAGGGSGTVVLQRSGRTVTVAPEQTVLQALQGLG